MKIDKRMMDVVQSIRDDKAMELFGRTEAGLNYVERLELDDWLSPKWKVVIEKDGNHIIEISNIGTCRYINGKRMIHIVYPKNGSYPFVSYYEHLTKGKQYIHAVHILVAQAFVSNDDPENKREINHIDGVKTHNWWHNLEWCTRSENTKHAYKTGLASVGENAGMAKYTNDEIRYVCQLLQDRPDLSFPKVAKLTNVSADTVCKIYNQSGWNHISKDYKFPPRASNKGEGHWNSTYTNDQIEHVCKLLSDPKYDTYTFQQIGEMFNMDEQTVGDIYRGTTHLDIINGFNFVPRNTRRKGESNANVKYSNAQIEQICQLLDSNMNGSTKLTQQQIADTTGTSRTTVSDVLHGKVWTEIAKSHPFYTANKKGGIAYEN